jgi:hypothetical protein
LGGNGEERRREGTNAYTSSFLAVRKPYPPFPNIQDPTREHEVEFLSFLFVSREMGESVYGCEGVF